MDFTNIKCISEECKKKNVTMGGAGATIGGRINIAKVRCPECGLTLMIIPISNQYEYMVKATTEEERKEERVREAMRESELALAKKITSIREHGY
jgi:ssDNA-binding Zn-finger/Zn-ribbon topoisomerase 1